MNWINLRRHIGYFSLVLAVIPSIIAISHFSVRVGKHSDTFVLVSFASLIFGLLSIKAWQGKVSIAIFLYFIYRGITDVVCMMTA